MVNRILVVEDDADIANLIRVNLTELGMHVTVCLNGSEGLEAATNKDFDLLILDVMLPDMSGLDICRKMRELKPQQAICMLTAKGSETDRVLGLELGADDYMTKPFSVKELQARVRSHLRRIDNMNKVSHTDDQNDQIQIGNLLIHIKQHRVLLNNEELDLTTTEFDLLYHLSKHPKQVFSRSQLLESVWGYQHSGYEHTVNSHINRLRAKIESDATHPQIIQTVWGVGYRFEPSGVAA